MMAKIVPKWECFIDDLGELHIKDIVRYKQYKLHLKGDAELILKKKSNRKQRSSNQNKYMHCVVFQMFADAMGCSMEEAKEALKLHFLSITLKGGLKSSRSTSCLNTTETEEFLSKCRMLASTMLDCYIPMPSEILIQETNMFIDN